MREPLHTEIFEGYCISFILANHIHGLEIGSGWTGNIGPACSIPMDNTSVSPYRPSVGRVDHIQFHDTRIVGIGTLFHFQLADCTFTVNAVKQSKAIKIGRIAFRQVNFLIIAHNSAINRDKVVKMASYTFCAH